MKRTLIRLGLSVLVTSALFGCGGGGSDGINGPTVTVPVNVSNAQNVGSNSSSATSASVALWRSLEPKVTVTGVTIASPPVVRFAVTDAAGNALVGLGNKSQGSTATLAALTNLRFTLAKLVPATASAPSKWVSYLVTRPVTVAQAAGTFGAADSCDEVGKKWCGTFPTTDSEGTLVDNGDGTYVYTFARDITQAATIVASLKDSTDGLKKKADLGDVSYNAALTHRLGIQISGAAPGTGSNTPNGTTVIPGVNIAIPTNATYDFVPNGGAVTSTRNVVDKASCDSCHNGKGLAHGQGRNDPAYCVTCHTDQTKYGMSGEATRSSALVLNGTTQNTTSVVNGRAIADMPNLFHKVHMGSELKLSGYNYLPNSSGVGMNFNSVEWIQDPRSCTKCHSGDAKTDINQATQTKDGNNWKNKPSQLACGACHDNVDFAANTITTAAGVVPHSDAGMTDDSRCASCHTATTIPVYHSAEAPTANNSVVTAGVSTISYDIKSVTVNSSGAAVITFKITQDGAPVTSFASYESVKKQLIPGFNSGPSFYVSYAVPQDGIATPADFNTYSSVSLAALVAGTSPTTTGGTLTGPDASGYWIATLSGSSIKIPTTGVNKASMVTGSMIGNFTQVDFNAVKTVGLIDMTTDLGKKWNSEPWLNGSTGGRSPGPGLYIKTPLKMRVATGFTPRRVVVDNNKCESCHEQLGAAVEFHSGARNDATSCAICHNPNRTSSGWSANASTFVHGIHAGTNPTSVTAANKILATVGNPGPGSGGAGLNFSSGKRYVPFSWHRDSTGWNAAAMVYPGILKRCENCHVPNAVNFGANGSTLLPNLLWSTSVAGTPSTTDTYFAYPRDPVTGAVIYITPGTAYGSAFSYAPATDTATQAAATTLVESPITSACFACHDASTAKLHMTQYGGVIYGARSASTVSGVLVNGETCLTCHGMGRSSDAAVAHAK
jgi:OmcA/MtrC family decaheme c-type cytochrome